MFNGPDPRPRLPYVRLIAAKVGTPQKVILLSSEIHSVETHFLFTVTSPCTKRLGSCSGCDSKRAKRWKGYICAFDVLKAELALVEVTDTAILSCPALMYPGDNWRGQVLTIWRKEHKRGTVLLKLDEAPPTWPRPQNLPRPFSVWPIWNRVWDLTYSEDEWRRMRYGKPDCRDQSLPDALAPNRVMGIPVDGDETVPY